MITYSHQDRPEIPGISGVELDVMVSAAARILGAQTETTVARDLRALQLGTAPDAAGRTSAQRRQYIKVNNLHSEF